MGRISATLGVAAALLLFGSVLSVARADNQHTGDWDVAAAGARGDGAGDNTAIFQKSLDEAGRAGGGVVHVPAGRYRINSTLTIPAAVTLQGTYRVPPTVRQGGIDVLSGTVLLAYAGRGSATGPPFIRLAGSNSTLAGVIIFYPEWKQSDVPPVPYPPCVLSEDTENVGVQDCCLLNPYEGIRLVRSHRHLVRNITGYPEARGIFVDECYDIGHIENIHFWPFGVDYKPDNPFCLWVNTRGVACELARTDWEYVLNTFCFGYGVGYKFTESKTGSANGNFLGLGADSCQRAVLVEQAQGPGLLITNGEFVGRWSSKDAVCMEIGEKAEGKVSLANCSFWGPIDRCVWMRSATGQFTASGCHFLNWDVNSSGSPAIQLDAGKAIVQGCTFGSGDVTVHVGPSVASAILMGNQASGEFTVENEAGRHTQMAANQQESVDWTPEALAHYRVTLGAEGDGPYVRGWQGRETVPVEGQSRTQRWSTAASRLLLPVRPNRKYTITIDLSVPTAARSPDAGLYLGSQRILPLTASGHTILNGTLPPQKLDQVTLTLRCRGWVPRQEIPGSKDDRTLGMAVYSITLKARGAGERVFNANTGGVDQMKNYRSVGQTVQQS